MALSAVPLWLRRPGLSREQTAVGSGLQRARSFMVLATLLYRVSHLTVGLVAVLQHQRDQPVPYALLALALGLSTLVHGTALRRGWFERRHIWADVLVNGVALPLALYAWGGAENSAALGWTMLLGGSACATAALVLERLQVLGVVVLLAATHLLGYRLVDANTAVVLGHTNSLLSSAAMAWVFWWYLRRQGRLLDDANARALAAEATRARYVERLEHHRLLHDTVLATLTTLAGGGVDANTPQVRERCAREAAYLRRLIEQTTDEVHHRGIGEALEEVVSAAESLRLRVTARYHALPEVPPEVSVALAGAVREALNNVRRHAGTDHAYLTATGDPERPGAVVVTVVDRGCGFDPKRHEPGLGLRRSVCKRMTAVGGRAELDTEPGEGVRVELRWPG
ncbi:sensor histidine kinase [Streptomyces prasinus]|uniref:sensor histidine kinase n=1 Tax=Streptomyces prasinus TaxID=67345 RepID=UPI000A5FFB6A|nr:ATP-binding protein [Streptomyces prasinus]